MTQNEKVGTTNALNTNRTNINQPRSVRAARAAMTISGMGLGTEPVGNRAARAARKPLGLNPNPWNVYMLTYSYMLVYLYLSQTTLLTANDIEKNPGPKNLYPCGVCNKRVGWNVSAIACDDCKTWFHRNCLYMPSVIHKALSNPDASWVCCNCGVPSFSDSLFESQRPQEVSSKDKTSLLNSIDISSNSSNSPDCDDPGSPILASSPHQIDNCTSRKKTGNIRILVVNIQSVMAKLESWLALVDTSNPDVIIGTETWLKPHIHNHEFLPSHYDTFRCDRQDGYGGTLIAIKTNFICEEVPIQPELNLELSCAKVQLQNNKPPLIICSVYRPTNRDVEYCERLSTEIKRIANEFHSSTLWIGGDMNLPDLDWPNETILSNNYPVKINELILETTHDTALTQMVDFPTRGSNILDIFLTNRPTLVNKCEAIPGISDHDSAIFIEADVNAKLQKVPRRKIYLWSKGNMEEMRKDLESFSNEFTREMSVETPK